MCIEFDGQLHYQSVNWFGGIDQHTKIKENDSIKNEYCHNNSIRFLRIPYWEYDYIETVLQNHI